MNTRAPLLAAASAAAALAALPAAASAAPVPVVDGTTITITGDDTGEAVTVAEAGGQVTLNGANVGAAADGTFALVVNANGGDDNVAVNTNSLASVTVDGGDGDDLITGTTLADALRGGAGDDRVVGRPGDDDMDGGAGNDVLVWNNGDNSDAMDGDGGNDEIEVNGAATVGDAFTVAPNGQRVRFDRTNLVPFTLDVSAERMSLNGLGGDDTMTAGSGLAPLVSLSMDGGAGADALAGGDGADLVTGGEDADVLDGGPGGDRVLGDRGGDALRGGPGDDALVWNDGDGSDAMDGQDGLDRVEVNGATAGDVFTLAPNGPRARFARTNLVPFALDVGSTEALDLRGLGGDDAFTAAPGTPLAVLADGGPGNDALAGAEEPDTFLGGDGRDTLAGGAGPDLLDGQAGDDALLARDGAGDLVRGGEGSDAAQADAAGIDVLDGVESIDRPAPADEAATAVDVVSRRAAVKVKRRTGRARTRITLECPAAEPGGCEGRLTLLTARRFKVARVPVRLVLGSARFDLDAGERARVKVRLPEGVRKLARNRRIPVRAQATSRDAAGNLAQSSERVTLRLARRR